MPKRTAPVAFKKTLKELQQKTATFPEFSTFSAKVEEDSALGEKKEDGFVTRTNFPEGLSEVKPASVKGLQRAKWKQGARNCTITGLRRAENAVERKEGLLL
jgi:hypothetical protein